MERVHTLINKLQEQLNKNVDSKILLSTAELLVAELQTPQEIIKVGKVSVVIPAFKEIVEQEITPIVETPSLSKVVKKESFELVLDETVVEIEEEEFIPTLDLQDHSFQIEINDLVNDDTKSFNDLLNQNKKEVATSLIETPIKDLRKAIGINDKYVFINELFKGDEAAYESSIRTINHFSVYPEAEQWIKRELVVSFSWNNKSDIVQHFNHLVRRRFAAA